MKKISIDITEKIDIKSSKFVTPKQLLIWMESIKSIKCSISNQVSLAKLESVLLKRAFTY